MYSKFLYVVCEQNSNVKCPATPFSATWEGGGMLWDKLAHRSNGSSNTFGIWRKR
jgi:hypothetical protein